MVWVAFGSHPTPMRRLGCRVNLTCWIAAGKWEMEIHALLMTSMGRCFKQPQDLLCLWIHGYEGQSMSLLFMPLLLGLSVFCSIEYLN